MLNHRGFSAWITVGDEALPEYLVAVDDEAHRVSCWIPGDEGKNFTVWWTDHGGKVDTCSFIVLDGMPVPGRFLLGEGTAYRSGARSGPYKERPFTFTSVPGNTDDTSENAKPGVGTIVLKIKRVDRIACQPANAIQPLPITSTIPAKRRAGDLGIGLGPEKDAPMQYPLTWQVNPHDKVAGSRLPPTYVSFVFRYRSPEFLDAQGISPPATKKGGDKRRVASSSAPATGSNSSHHLSTTFISPGAPNPLSQSHRPDQAVMGQHYPPSGMQNPANQSSYYRNYYPSSSMVTPQAQSQAQTPAQPPHSRTNPTSAQSSAPVNHTESLVAQAPQQVHQTAFFLPRTEAQQRVASGSSIPDGPASMGMTFGYNTPYATGTFAYPSQGPYAQGALPLAFSTPSYAGQAPDMSSDPSNMARVSQDGLSQGPATKGKKKPSKKSTSRGGN